MKDIVFEQIYLNEFQMKDIVLEPIRHNCNHLIHLNYLDNHTMNSRVT